MSNSRFAVAVHILAGLTIVKILNKEDSVPSERIAWSVGTNPVVVRRILGQLRKAGLVASSSGATGGSKIQGDPREITLLDIYRAVENGQASLFPRHTPNPSCPVGANVFAAVEPAFNRARLALQQALAKVTIEEIAREIMELYQREAAQNTKNRTRMTRI